MECGGISYIYYGSRTDKIKLYNLADLHIGSACCAEDKLAEDIKSINEDPFAYWCGGGDYIDAITTDDKRWDPTSVNSKRFTIADLARCGMSQMEAAADILSPIKEKCLGMLLGNHEKAYMNHKEQDDLQRWLCKTLGVINLGYCAFADIMFTRSTLPQVKEVGSILSHEYLAQGRLTALRKRVFLHHGAGYANTEGGKLNRLLQFMMRFPLAAIYFVGHVHDEMGKRLTILDANSRCDKIVGVEKIGLISGGYLKTTHK